MPCGQTRFSGGIARKGPSVSTSSSHCRCSSATLGALGPAALGWSAGHQLDPPVGVGAGQREHDRCRGRVRLDVGVAVGDRGDLACLLVVELVEPALHRLDVAPPLASAGRRRTAGLGLALPRRCSAASESRRLVRKAAKISCARWVSAACALGELLHDELVPARRRGPASTLPGAAAAARRARSTGRRAGCAPARWPSVESVAVERLVERGLGLLLGHGAATLQPNTGEEDLLVQADAASADEDHPRDRRDEGLRQVVDDDSRDSVQRRVDAPQRAAQQPLRLLHDRVPEVDVDQVARGPRRRAASNVIGRGTPGLQPGVRALAACRASRRSSAGTVEHLGVGAVDLADRDQRRAGG